MDKLQAAIREARAQAIEIAIDSLSVDRVQALISNAIANGEIDGPTAAFEIEREISAIFSRVIELMRADLEAHPE